MRLPDFTILITADIDELLLNEITSKGIKVDVIPFIQTAIIQSKNIQAVIQNILKLNTTVVFTSRHAVEAVAEYLQNKKPDWRIYCIGNTTKLLIEKLFGKESVMATADNAHALAEKIVINKECINEVNFFCGNKKRNELPHMLKENNIVINEIEVYTTSILKHKIEKDYNAILFFSPSAVDGFFKNNTIKQDTVLFAIGKTTADEVKKFSENKIVISNEPGKKNLAEKLIAFRKQIE